MCGYEGLPPEVEELLNKLLVEADSRAGIISSIFIDPEPAKPVTFEDMISVRDNILARPWS